MLKSLFNKTGNRFVEDQLFTGNQFTRSHVSHGCESSKGRQWAK